MDTCDSINRTNPILSKQSLITSFFSNSKLYNSSETKCNDLTQNSTLPSVTQNSNLSDIILHNSKQGDLNIKDTSNTINDVVYSITKVEDTIDGTSTGTSVDSIDGNCTRDDIVDVNVANDTINVTNIISTACVESSSMDLDISGSLSNLNSVTMKRRIIDDDYDNDFDGINESASKSVAYSTTKCSIDNNLWDSNSEDETLIFKEDVTNNTKLTYSPKFNENSSNITKSTCSKDISVNNIGCKKPTNSNVDKLSSSDNYANITDERNYYLSCYVSRVCKIFADYIENYYLYCDTFSFPPWIQPCYIRDASGRRPDSPDYNPSTILIPPPGHKWVNECRSIHYTPTMRQYWSIKSNHFDKIVFFKMGRFYEIFYIDACIGHKLCDLRWMGKEVKPHIGFPEQSLKYYASKLVNSGYKVVVVEQMETPKEMLAKTRAIRGSEKVIAREVCQILSKGTLIHPTMLPFDSQPLLSIVFDTNGINMLDNTNCNTNDDVTNTIKLYNFGACLIDVSTNSISLSFHTDDESRIGLRTLLLRADPAEILYMPHNVDKDVMHIFTSLPSKPQLSTINGTISTNIDIDMYNIDIHTICTNVKDTTNDTIDGVSANDKDGNDTNGVEVNRDLIVLSLGLASRYLSEMGLESVVSSGNISISNRFIANRMRLNSFVYDHLEIFRTSLGGTKNSFFSFINHTSTAFGSRLLRQWVSSPSTNLSVINSRLDTVEWLVDNPRINNEIRRILSGCLDLERLIGSITNTPTKKRAIKFDHIQSNHLLEFHKLLGGFEPFEALRSLLCSTSCIHLSSLLTYDNNGGLYPNIKPYITYFLDKFQIVDKQCYPKRGVYDQYDKIYEKIEHILHKLQTELDTLSDSLNVTLNFVHSKYKYEVESPDFLQKKIASQYEITSTRKGYVRFRTPNIITLVDKLEDLEFDRWECLTQCFVKILDEFKPHIPNFTKCIQIIAEIDCLCTFAYIVLSNNYDMCKPKLHPMHGKPFMKLESAIHPIIGLTVSDFVSNNVYMNCGEESNLCLLLTGPNMGGKSTLLRQICLITMMAQIGSFVPAKTFEFTIADKIYTRLGARDSIMQGKSTFLIELEETSTMMQEATPYSLVMIDELGRGTSTYDGMAIASSSLFYIANRISCRCIFSTHYHLICNEARLSDSITLYCMSSSVVNGELKLLYKFTKGECHKSQGLNVAKLAGIPESVIKLAQNIANAMEIKINNESSGFKLLQEYLRLVKMNDFNKLKILYNTTDNITIN